MKVLFVCLGNICRSPTAEGICRSKIRKRGLPIQTDSAGTAAYHVGNPPDPRSVQTASGYGYDLSDLRPRQVQPADFHEFDVILAMDHQNYQDLVAIRPADASAELVMMLGAGDSQSAEVPDPYYGGEQGFHGVVELLEGAADAWLERWSSRF